MQDGKSYEVGFIFTDCHIQKNLEILPDIMVMRLTSTGSRGQIHNARNLLKESNFPFSQENLKRTVDNFIKTGQSVVIVFKSVTANSYEQAIKSLEGKAELVAGALAVLSANPANLLCAYAKGNFDSGVNFYFPPYRLIEHATNVKGFLDATPKLAEQSLQNPKLTLLLRLYRASLRERDEDYRMMFQLILLEEISDNAQGKGFAERLRSFCTHHNILNLFNGIAVEIGFKIPQGKDMVDALVKLRNSVAHNGTIDQDTLRQSNGKWLFPLLNNKEGLHKLVGETIRFALCCLVGLESTKIRVKTGETFEVSFG